MHPTLSNLLHPAQLFSNPATRWRSSMLGPYKTLLVSTWTKVWKVCVGWICIFKQSWYVYISLDTLRNIFQSSISVSDWSSWKVEECRPQLFFNFGYEKDVLKLLSVLSESIFSESVFSKSVFPESVFSESVCSESVFS